VNAPADLAARRALRAEAEAEAEVWTVRDHQERPDGMGVIAELGDRLDRIERRLTALERRGRL
jgi:hypothetical protein